MMKKIISSIGVAAIMIFSLSIGTLANDETPENMQNQKPPVEMFYGDWRYIKEDSNSICDFTLNSEEYSDGDQYSYSILNDGVMQNPEKFVEMFGEGYYLELTISFDDEVKDAILLRMEEPWSQYVYEYSQFYSDEDEGWGLYDPAEYAVGTPHKFRNQDQYLDGKKAVTYQIGDAVKAAGLMVMFTGTVTDVNGDLVQVYWNDIVDIIWEQSTLDSMTYDELWMNQTLTGIQLFSASWINKTDLAKRSN